MERDRYPTLDELCKEPSISPAAFVKFSCAAEHITDAVKKANAALDNDLRDLRGTGVTEQQLNLLKFLALDVLKGACRNGLR